jgi:alkylation response protein AidB-like acyl-CoA dehydrogenase
MNSEGRLEKGMGGIIHKVCRDFCRNEVEPVALELDARPDPERIRRILRKSLELELPSMLIPEEYGGVGQGPLTAAQVLDELAQGCAGVAAVFAHHLAACIPLAEAGRAHEELLSLLAEGRDGEPVTATLAFPGLEERDDRPRLEESGGDLTLSGVAPLVACASLADYLVLFVEEGEGGGITPVVVDAHGEGVSAGEPEELLGLHTVPFSDVTFDRCRLPADSVIGERGGGASILEKTRAVFNGFLAAAAMGAARSAYTKAYQYAQERYQFGKMIIEHHEIRRFLANMLVKMNMGTAGYLRAFSGEKLESPLPGSPCDQAKIFCTDAALEITLDAIQVHGGYGYMKETGLEKIMRDAKMLQLLGGSNRLLEVG